MCGLVGYIGNEEAVGILLAGLRELEYRGYDSAGLAVLQGGDLRCFRAVGKLDNLAGRVKSCQTSGPVAGIGHTRWATHGKPCEVNAHPHGLTHSQVVHNGIIENYRRLKESISTTYLSQTDTEVIVHLFEHQLAARDNDPAQALAAFRATLDQLRGAYAILLLTKLAPGQILFARQGSPLQFSLSDEGCFFASSDAPLLAACNQAVYLKDGQWGVADARQVRIFDDSGQEVEPVAKPLPVGVGAARKEGFRYYMEKEIYEQPAVLTDILTGRIHEICETRESTESHESPGKLPGADNGQDHLHFEEIPPGWLQDFSSLVLCACGTSYHAALTAGYLLERKAGIPCKVEIASEFRYRRPVLDSKALLVVISQSGETADTLEALKLAKRQGLTSLALCNVDNSSIVREADRTILLRAGIEKGVASTKAFAAQVMNLWMLAVTWGGERGRLSPEETALELQALRRAPAVVQVSKAIHERIHRLSKRYLHGHGFFFLGRDIFYPLALEGALKLKEISYLHAEGYPAGEMKHGPIALADAELFTIALMPQSTLYEKIKSNVEELSARDATIVAITTEYFELADDIIQIDPYDHPMLEFFAMMVVVQLLAMEIAIRLGNDVDMPRNLAKSVTVE